MSVELFAEFLRMELSVTQICELVPSTESMEDGRVLTELERPAGLRISPVQTDSKLFVEKKISDKASLIMITPYWHS